MAKTKKPTNAQLAEQVAQLKNQLHTEREKVENLSTERSELGQELARARAHAEQCEKRTVGLLKSMQDEDREIVTSVHGSHKVVRVTDRLIKGVVEPAGTIIGFITPASHYDARMVADSVVRGSSKVVGTLKESDYLERADLAIKSEQLEAWQAKVDTAEQAQSDLHQQLELAQQSIDEANAVVSEKDHKIEELEQRIADLAPEPDETEQVDSASEDDDSDKQ